MDQLVPSSEATAPHVAEDPVQRIKDGISVAEYCLLVLKDQLNGTDPNRLIGESCQNIQVRTDPAQPHIVTFSLQVNLNTNHGLLVAENQTNDGLILSKQVTNQD